MTEKVKVSREVAEVLDATIERWEGDVASIIANYVRGGCGGFWTGNFKTMRVLSDDELFRALYVGYEIEETPEEKLLLTYNYKYGRAWGDGYSDGVRYGIVKALDTFNIKIKGIND